jgi:hypothetical protein
MSKVRIAFDVDGTLRCNCTDDCQDPNQRIVDLFHILNSFKNTELYVWSGGGADYARRFADKFDLPITAGKCLSKVGTNPDFIHIAIDDIQDTAIGNINLIVHEKGGSMYKSGASNPTLADLQFEQSLVEWNRVRARIIARLKAKHGKETVELWLKK